MKYLVLFLTFFYNINCFSQDLNPLLFQTWYLNTLRSDDTEPYFDISKIEPSITPTLTIAEDLTFSGQGACNSFKGKFEKESNFEIYNTINFSKTEISCESPLHNTFEYNYFSFFLKEVGIFIIKEVDEGLELFIPNQLFGSARFTNYKLNSKDFNFNQIAIYPNPINTSFSLQSNQLKVSKIQIINLVGQNVKNINDHFEKVDISDLASGVYVLKISTENGIVNKRIIKN